MDQEMKAGYNRAKQLAKEIWFDNNETEDASNRYYFNCGFAAGLKYQNLTREEIEAIQCSINAMSHPHKNDVYICNSNFNAIFNIDELINLSKAYKVSEIKIHDLEDAFYRYSSCIGDTDTQNRINNADLSYPIIVASNKKGKIIAVLDGTHRIRKAIKCGLKKINAVIIPKKQLSHFKSSKIFSKIIISCAKLQNKELELLKHYIESYLQHLENNLEKSNEYLLY